MIKRRLGMAVAALASLFKPQHSVGKTQETELFKTIKEASKMDDVPRKVKSKIRRLKSQVFGQTVLSPKCRRERAKKKMGNYSRWRNRPVSRRNKYEPVETEGYYAW